MGNIVTPEQGYLPIPALGAGAMWVYLCFFRWTFYFMNRSPYPWWLTGALAIWALLALLCCWLLLLLLLLRFCCKRWRHLRYAADVTIISFSVAVKIIFRITFLLSVNLYVSGFLAQVEHVVAKTSMLDRLNTSPRRPCHLCQLTVNTVQVRSVLVLVLACEMSTNVRRYKKNSTVMGDRMWRQLLLM